MFEFGKNSRTSNDPYSAMEEGSLNVDTAAAFYDKEVRQGFIRKVFGILFVQLAITTGVAALMMMNQGINAYLSVNPWPLWTAMVVSFVTIIAMACKPELSRTYPTNYALLGVFTLAESVLIGMICMLSDTRAVLLAALITTAIVGTLTLYALQTKHDFTTLGGAMLGILMAFILVGFIKVFLPHSKIMELVYAGIGAAIFSVYLVVDIQMLMDGKRMQISPDDYILASINLYLDVLNIFIYILQIINSSNRS